MITALPFACPSCGRRLGNIETQTRVCLRRLTVFDGVRCVNHHRHPNVRASDACRAVLS